jgi:hypothetical protein
MAEEFHLDFSSEELAREAESRLRELRYEGDEALSVVREGTDLLCGCQVWTDVSSDAVLQLDGSKTVPFFDAFYKIDTVKSGMHHPDGMLWIRRPGAGRSEAPGGKVPLTAIAPTILGMYGLDPPDYMRGEMLAEPVAAA